MRQTKMLCFVALAMLWGSALTAEDIAGDWQGTLKTGSQDLRIIVKIAKGDGGSWKASLYSIDQTTDPIPVSSVTLEDSNLKLAVEAVQGVFEGKVSADGASIDGTWTQGQPLPLALRRATKETAWPTDAASHSIQFVTVDKDVKLEVLDWGGSGRPLVLLTGLGNNAHVYDKFAPKLTGSYHVYGITRRGFGASSGPATGYSADRLGDDVLAVLDSLKLNRPVLVGHSIGGEELSSVGSRHPEKVAGLIYLDSGYFWAYYDRARGNVFLDLDDLLKKLARLSPGKGTGDPRPLIQELLESSLPKFEQDLRDVQKDLQAKSRLISLALWTQSFPTASQAIMAGIQKYTTIPVPVLAIYAIPPNLGPELAKDATERAATEARDVAAAEAQAKAFENGVPSARIVRLLHADHYVFLSNEGDVLREMNTFLRGLP